MKINGCSNFVLLLWEALYSLEIFQLSNKTLCAIKKLDNFSFKLDLYDKSNLQIN